MDLPSPQDCPILLAEFDAEGQEARFMADFSGDETMINIFNRPSPEDDLHSFTGAQVSGMSFAEFLEGKANGDESIVGPRGFRYQGKFCNLSMQYRIGIRTLRIKARVDYGMDVPFSTAKYWDKTYHRTYLRVKEYWARAIKEARQNRYAETLGGRRFKITEFSNPDLIWASESSAINFPIQGSGADMKELALAIMTLQHPEFRFAWDLHDGLFFRVRNSPTVIEQMLEAQNTLNNLNYKEAWHWEPRIPMPWSIAIGENWGSLEEITNLEVPKCRLQ